MPGTNGRDADDGSVSSHSSGDLEVEASGAMIIHGNNMSEKAHENIKKPAKKTGYDEPCAHKGGVIFGEIESEVVYHSVETVEKHVGESETSAMGLAINSHGVRKYNSEPPY